MTIMRRPLLVFLAVVALSTTTARAFALVATQPFDADSVDQSARKALADKKYAFCNNPARPFLNRQETLCALRDEVPQCTGFRTACEVPVPEKHDSVSFLQKLAEFLGPAARILVYLLVVGIIIIVAIPVLRALLRFRRNRKIVAKSDRDGALNRAELVIDKPIVPDEIANAEDALRRADDLYARGQLDRALSLYLAASLAALDRRGAIRIGKHRTNGEYVRSCQDEAARPPLREIVREVDKAEFGATPPTNESVATAASKAKTIVRKAATFAAMTLFVLGIGGCDGASKGSDPAGDELPMEVLRRNGFNVGTLKTSLATLPIPEDKSGDDDDTRTKRDARVAHPLVIIDVERVVLEDETKAHLMRWVEAGGVLVLFGGVYAWPKELLAKTDFTKSRDLNVRVLDPEVLDDIQDSFTHPDEDATSLQKKISQKTRTKQGYGVPIKVVGARLARSDSFRWEEDTAHYRVTETIATLTNESEDHDVVFASKKYLGKGLVLGVANDDLFTNIGVLPKHNAAALVALMRAAADDPSVLRPLGMTTSRERTTVDDGKGGPLVPMGDASVARSEDGVPPPSNPFAALLAAGLAKGVFHAFAFAIILFLAYGIRHARPRTKEQPSRRAFAEHVEATGAFYGRARAHAHALSAYGRFMEIRLREMLPRGADPIAFLAARSGLTEARTSELYTRATQAKAGDVLRGDELSVIEDLRQMMEKAAHQL